MIDPRSALRLLREDWRDPVRLAEELYAMISSNEPREVQAPVTIRVPRGQTALKLVQGGTPTPTVSTRSPARPAARAPSAAGEPSRRAAFADQARKRASPFDDPGVTPPGDQADGARRAALPAPRTARSDTPLAAPVKAPPATVTPAPAPIDPAVGIAVSAQFHPRPASLLAEGRTPSPFPAVPVDATPVRPPSPKPPLSRPGRRPPPRPGAGPDPGLAIPGFEPYTAPILDIHGQIAFRGEAPAQFDVPPRVLNPETGGYEPFAFRPVLAKIPREMPANTTGWLGKVVSGTGNAWKVKLYIDGPNDDSTAYTIGVQVLNIPDASTDSAPVGLWIDRIVQYIDPYGGEDQYWWVMPTFSKIAQTDSGGIPAMAGTTPGSATCTIFDFNGTTLTSGRSVTVFNMTATAVAGTKYIQVKFIDGCYFVDVEDCA